MSPEDLIKHWTRGPFQRMAEIFRFSSWPMHHRESVAEHSYFVALYAWVIGLHLKGRGENVNIEELLTKAIAHDMDEALTGDFIRSFKHSDPELKDRLQTQAAKGLVKSLCGPADGPGDVIFQRWSTAKQDTLEGHILELADLWSTATTTYREFLMGSEYATRILLEVAGWLHRKQWRPQVKDYAAGVEVFARRVVRFPEAVRKEAINDLDDPYWRVSMKEEPE